MVLSSLFSLESCLSSDSVSLSLLHSLSKSAGISSRTVHFLRRLRRRVEINSFAMKTCHMATPDAFRKGAHEAMRLIKADQG